MMHLQQAVVTEGKYDAARLANLTDATILLTDGFGIFKDKPKQALFKRLAAAQGLLVLTDSDAAGFQIRRFVTGLVGARHVLQAYIPAVPGKEKRKAAPGKEGLLGVEGVPDALILQALQTALSAAPPAAQMQPENARPVTHADLCSATPAAQAQPEDTRPITYTDLYDWGLSGTPDSAARRRALLPRLGLPPRLSKRELLQVLNTLYTYDALTRQITALCAPAAPRPTEAPACPQPDPRSRQ